MVKIKPFVLVSVLKLEFCALSWKISLVQFYLARNFLLRRVVVHLEQRGLRILIFITI